MRLFISYSLMVFFALAIHSKSIEYALKYLQGIDLCADTNLCCEEQNEEEKKSEEEKELDDLINKLFIDISSENNCPIYISSKFLVKNKFYYSEYYKKIYSPPELA